MRLWGEWTLIKQSLLSLAMALAFAGMVRAGEPNALSLLPDEKREDILKTYADQPKPKLLAASRNGHYAYFSNKSGTEDPVSVRRLALERCRLLADSDCAVVAIDDDFQGEVKLEQTSFVSSGPTNYDAIPTEPSDFKDKSLQKYLSTDGHRALALSGNGGWGGAWQRETVEQARADALANCQMNAKPGQDCFIYDQDGQIAPDWGLRLEGKKVEAAHTDCSEHIWIQQGERCKTGLSIATVSGGFRGNFPSYLISKDNSGLIYVIQLRTAPVGRNYFLAASLEERSQAIAAFLGQGISELSDPVVAGDLTYRRVRVKGWSCVGFYDIISIKLGGYGSYMVGLYCDKFSQAPLDDRQISAFVGAIHVKE